MNVTVDTSGFRAMVRELGTISGKDQRTVIRAEAGRVLETAMRWTGAANKKAYLRQGTTLKKHNDADSEIIHINQGKRGPEGRAWYSNLVKGTYKHYIVSAPWGQRPKDEPGRKKPKGSGPMKWPARIWSKAQALWAEARKLEAARAKAAAKGRIAKEDPKNPKNVSGRGLAKQSWKHIADSLGLTLKGVTAAVRNAKPQDGKVRQSGIGLEGEQAAAFFIELRNFYPMLMKGRSPKSGQGKFDGAAILARSIKSRVTAFSFALRKGVFNDLKLRASRYPSIFSVS